MDYVMFKLTPGTGVWYRMECRSHQDLFLLSMFLTDDVGPGDGPNRWIQWIENPITESTGANFCSLEKNGDFVILGCDLDFSEQDCGPIPFKIPTAQLIHILEEWRQVRINKPDEVIITRENDVYQVIQKSNDMSQA